MSLFKKASVVYSSIVIVCCNALIAVCSRIIRMPRLRTVQRGEGHAISTKTHISNTQKRGFKLTVSNSDSRMIKTVEQTVKRFNMSNKVPTKLAIWKNMPVKVSYPRFIRIVRQLERENKLILDKDLVVWTLVESPQARRSLQQSVDLN